MFWIALNVIPVVLVGLMCAIWRDEKSEPLPVFHDMNSDCQCCFICLFHFAILKYYSSKKLLFFFDVSENISNSGVDPSHA